MSQQRYAEPKKGFVQVERKAANADGGSDMLDPLSMFAMQDTSTIEESPAIVLGTEAPTPSSTAVNRSTDEILTPAQRLMVDLDDAFQEEYLTTKSALERHVIADQMRKSQSEHNGTNTLTSNPLISVPKIMSSPKPISNSSTGHSKSAPILQAAVPTQQKLLPSVATAGGTFTTAATATAAAPARSMRSHSLAAPETKAFDEDILDFLTGEQKIMSIPDAYLFAPTGSYVQGILFMTNYRLAFIPPPADLHGLVKVVGLSIHSWLQIPLAAIDRLEREKRSSKEPSNGTVSITITSKDCRQHRITIKSNMHRTGGSEYDIERAVSVIAAYAFPNNMRYLFAFSHKLSGVPIPTADGSSGSSGNSNGTSVFDPYLEYSRMGVLDSNQWRVSLGNAEFKLCATYPRTLIAPSTVSDEELSQVATFRSGRRLPVLCWADGSGVSMWRSSQPKSGVSGVSCLQDEKMLETIARSCTYNRKLMEKRISQEPVLHIVDCRSRASAMANRAAGAGYESQTNYPHSRLEFYSIPNIHAVRDSLRGLSNIILNPSANAGADVTFSKQIEDTQWLTNIRAIIKAAYDTAGFIHAGYPVLVHCSHGWDRTAQVCALAQLLLDPYYRTMEGFKILVEKEWCSFGHPFQMRCAHGQDKAQRQEDQFSPIMIQFLDCVWQLQKTSPQFFEFNARFILTVADHVYSGRFETFLFSSDYERDVHGSRQSCPDLWSYLQYNREVLRNDLYVPFTAFSVGDHKQHQPLLPPLTQLLRGVSLWGDYFLRWSSVPSLQLTPPALAHSLYTEDGICRPVVTRSSVRAAINLEAFTDNPRSGDTTTSVQNTTTNTTTTITTTTAAASTSISMSIQEVQPDVGVEAQTQAQQEASRAKQDLEIKASVTSWDFWEGAYRREKEMRLRAEAGFGAHIVDQQAKIDMLCNLLRNKVPDMPEEELAAALSATAAASAVPSGGEGWANTYIDQLEGATAGGTVSASRSGVEGRDVSEPSTPAGRERKASAVAAWTDDGTAAGAVIDEYYEGDKEISHLAPAAGMETHSTATTAALVDALTERSLLGGGVEGAEGIDRGSAKGSGKDLFEPDSAGSTSFII